MTDVRVLVVEDEPILRLQLCRALRELWPQITSLDEADCGATAMRQCAKSMPDIAFLDIHLPDMTGLEIAAVLHDRCHVVFVTAYSEYAVAAFEQHAIDYILKPATSRRLKDTVDRLKNRIGAPVSAPAESLLDELAKVIAPHGKELKWLNAAFGNVIRLIPVSAVRCFHADDKYTIVTTDDGEAVIRKPIRDLLSELPSDQFWQLHRATIVKVSAIDRVVRLDNGQLEVRLHGVVRPFPVSRAFANRFRQM